MTPEFKHTALAEYDAQFTEICDEFRIMGQPREELAALILEVYERGRNDGALLIARAVKRRKAA